MTDEEMLEFFEVYDSVVKRFGIADIDWIVHEIGLRHRKRGQPWPSPDMIRLRCVSLGMLDMPMAAE